MGGLAGSLLNNSSITNSYSTAAVWGPNLVGGIAGVLYGDSTVVNSYSGGNVSATYDHAGGLVGRLEANGSVVRSYSAGPVSGTTSVGGFVGNVADTYTITNCFWDRDTSGQSESAGVGATGKSTADMKIESTFTAAGWVFPGAWDIDSDVNDGYPHPVVYALTYSSGLNGSLIGALSQIVPYGGNGSPVEAVPDAGYRFTQWSDGITDNPRTDFNVAASIAVTAEFTVDLKYVIAILQVLAGMKPQVNFIIDDGPVGIPDALRLLQSIGQP